MSFNIIKRAFESMKSNNTWSLHLIRINKPDRGGAITYFAHPVTLQPQDALHEFVKETSYKFWQPEMHINRGKLNEYMDVVDYDGTMESKKIYRINTDHELIQADMAKLYNALADVDMDNDWSNFENAYVIRGRITLENEEIDVMLISVRKPVTVLNHKFKLIDDNFQEMKEKVLSLTPVIDMMIVGQMAYFFTGEAEKLFDLERSYRKNCDCKVAHIIELNIVKNSDAFKTFAKKGFNPRRFVTFSSAKLEALQSSVMRATMSETFGIPLEEGGDRFDITDAQSADKLIKLLCNKGMIDAFDKCAIEVSGAKQWQ